ncbi:MAG: DegT/DnrJ/EryC1/StrS family aminotransferase [Planctomycetota bacterium]|jgi:dTDP-4-amino-4,6-dideoxygalactose transaminase|nr:DegT/DnrJ/EryC1/StrS family aminotransferase [Planctomycetota bacterium]
MAIPFFDIGYNLGETEKAELLKRWATVLEHGGFINGPEVGELEIALADYLGVAHVVACSNGSDALVLALRAAGVCAGDEVILPAFTFFATAGAVSRIGATPIFADISPQTFCLEPNSVSERITERTRAIMPVHLYGRPADISALRAVAGDIPIVEDSAQAVGAVSVDGPCGGLGLVAGFSCFPTKNLGACGDAGFVSTNDSAVAEHIRHLKEHGGGRQYYHDDVGFNFRHDTLQAAALLARLPQLPVYNAARAEGAEHYTQLLSEIGCTEAEGAVRPPARHPGHVWHQFVCRIPGQRDELRAFLQKREIGSAVYYPLPLHLQPCFADLGGAKGMLPESERAAEEVLALPIYPGVTAEQREEVVAGIAAFLGCKV